MHVEMPAHCCRCPDSGITAPVGLGGSVPPASPPLLGPAMNMEIFQESHAHFMNTGSGIKTSILQSFLKGRNGDNSGLTTPKCK